MSLSRQNREEETLTAYFKQMLSCEEQEIDAAKGDTLSAEAALPDSAREDQFSAVDIDKTAEEPKVHAALDYVPEKEEAQFELKMLPEKKEQETEVSFAEGPSLEKLLSEIHEDPLTAVETQTETQTQTASETVTEQSQVQTEVLEDPKVKTQEAPVVVDETAAASDAALGDKYQNKVLTQAGIEGKSREVFESWENINLGREFQTLFFLAGGVRFAVPLIDLGSIFETPKYSYIIGQPAWFLGMTDIRGRKVNLVDTLRFIKEDYQGREEPYPYIITLGQTRWAIGCDTLEGNRTILNDDVKWRQHAGTRPWLAGIVKEQMCALIHVKALSELFENGFNPRILDQIKDLPQ